MYASVRWAKVRTIPRLWFFPEISFDACPRYANHFLEVTELVIRGFGRYFTISGILTVR